MMDRREQGQYQFFYDFHLDAVVPPDHLVRRAMSLSTGRSGEKRRALFVSIWRLLMPRTVRKRAVVDVAAAQAMAEVSPPNRSPSPIRRQPGLGGRAWTRSLPMTRTI